MELELIDMNYKNIKIGQSVELFGMKGKICFELGSYGIGFDECIDYFLLQKMVDEIVDCGNTWSGVYNDNFLSLFELHWNFNCEEDCIYVLEIVK